MGLAAEHLLPTAPAQAHTLQGHAEKWVRSGSHQENLSQLLRRLPSGAREQIAAESLSLTLIPLPSPYKEPQKVKRKQKSVFSGGFPEIL